MCCCVCTALEDILSILYLFWLYSLITIIRLRQYAFVVVRLQLNNSIGLKPEEAQIAALLESMIAYKKVAFKA